MAKTSDAQMVAFGDQVQQMCIDSGLGVAAFVVFFEDGPVEYRSPYPIEVLKDHLRQAAEEL